MPTARHLGAHLSEINHGLPGTVYYGYEGCPIAVTRDGTLCYNCSMGTKLCSQHAHLGDHKNEQEFIASAMEKSELQAKVLKFAPSSEELSELLAKARASENTAGAGAGAKRDFDSTTDGPVPMDIDDPFEP